MVLERFPATLMDQVEYMCRNMADQQLHLVLSLDGRLDADRMARALRLTLDSEPVLGSRFTERAFRPYWERRDDLDELSPCTVTQVGQEGLEGALFDFITAPADPRTDVVARAAIFRAEKDTLCIKLDHAASDGGGLKEYAGLLSSTYRRLGEDPGFLPAASAGADRTLHQVYRNFTRVERMKSLAIAQPPRAVWGFPWEEGGHSETAFAVRLVDAEAFGAIRDLGKRTDSTVNDLLLTAFFRALFEMNDPEPGVRLPIQVPIDLRRYLPGGRAQAVCNCSGQLHPTIERKPGEGFAATLARVRGRMNSFKTRSPGVGAAILIELLASPGFAITRRVYDGMVRGMERSGKAVPFLSNFGVLPEDDLELGDVGVSRAFMVSPVMFPPGFLLGASSFRDSMTLTAGFSRARANGRVVERFLDALEGELVAATR